MPYEIRGDGNIVRRRPLFDELRLWAYQNVSEYGDEVAFIDAVTAQGNILNEYHLRSPKDLEAVAASVAVWTWERLGSKREGF